jgi:hypothetical protein
MTHSNSPFARLGPDQLSRLTEAERTLGADVLLAYEPAAAGGAAQPGQSPAGELSAASLSESQIECLRGLENSLGALVIAYQR